MRLTLAFQKAAPYLFAIFTFTATLAFFQNCSGGFKSQNLSSSNLQTLAVLPTCSPTQSQSCEIQNGLGIQFCSASGVALACQIESCRAGYKLVNGSCLAVSCTANSTTMCSENNGTGNKICNLTGTGFGNCQLNACNTGYNLLNGLCQANACTPNANAICNAGNGMGNQICNSQGTAFGTCMLTSCNAGFNLQNGKCLANACTPTSMMSCAENNGSGTKICNSTGTGFGACQINACSAGYNLMNGVCIANSCIPNTNSVCSANNGSGLHMCNATGTGYGACSLSTCSVGYNLQNGNCVTNACIPRASDICTEGNGSGMKICNDQGTGYGTCALSVCNSGFNLQNGICLMNICNPNQTSPCSADHGMGIKTCNAQGTAFGSCQISSCSDGFILTNGVCSKIKFKDVKVAYTFSCGVTDRDKVMCWGENLYGNLGNNSTTASTAPVEVIGVSNVKQIGIGQYHGCALTYSNTVKCWGGANRSGDIESKFSLIGNGNSAGSLTAVDVNLGDVVEISASYQHTCALLSNGSVKCWGMHFNGNLGTLTPFQDGSAYSPYLVTGISDAKKIAAGEATCAITTADKVKCWGIRPTVPNGVDNLPVEVSMLSGLGVLDVTSNRSSSCALLPSGTTKCWGANDFGQLGNNSTIDSASTLVSPNGNLSGLKQVAKIDAYTCAITASDTVKCWGGNFYGNLGNNTQINMPVPVDVIGLTDVKGITLNAFNACALTAQNDLKCWGLINGQYKLIPELIFP